MLGMAEELGLQSLFWDEDQSWAFPILAADDENGGKTLIEDGKILTEIGSQQTEEKVEEEAAAPPVVVKGKKRAAAASKQGGGDEGNSGGGGESDEHELHIWTERERRKKMRDMFANLHALIPNIHPRADKSTIVDEAILYIRKLALTLENLEKLKKEMMREGNANLTSCDATFVTQPELQIQSREAFLADQVCTSQQAAVTPDGPNPLSSGPEYQPVFKTWISSNVIINICGKDAHISVCCPKKPGPLTAILSVMEKYKLEVISAQVSSDRGTRMYSIHARANGDEEQFQPLFLVEETYKQAAAEIMLCFNS